MIDWSVFIPFVSLISAGLLFIFRLPFLILAWVLGVIYDALRDGFLLGKHMEIIVNTYRVSKAERERLIRGRF